MFATRNQATASMKDRIATTFRTITMRMDRLLKTGHPGHREPLRTAATHGSKGFLISPAFTRRTRTKLRNGRSAASRPNDGTSLLRRRPSPDRTCPCEKAVRPRRDGRLSSIAITYTTLAASASSRSSTFFMAAIAHSIWPSSGSRVVRRCICMPGHRMTLTNGFSGWLPAHFTVIS